MMKVGRRQFIKLASVFGFTAATVAVARGFTTKEAVASVSKEEGQLRKNAEHTMIIATGYIIGTSRAYPLLQLNLKENIQNLTGGRVYVKLAPGGQLGVGGTLVQKVQGNTIQAGQHSIANFAPFAPIVDLINIPFWCGLNQEFVNLVTSKIWQDSVNSKVEERGFKILLYITIDPRVVALRKGIAGPVKTPDHMKGIKFRVPGSKILQKYYRLVGANPTPVAWGETSSAIKQGVADALDPCVGALLVFGFSDILDSITFTAPVPDAQVYSVNLKWFQSLPGDIQEAITYAGEVTQMQNLSTVPAARAYAMRKMKNAGVKFYTPTKDERQKWIDKAGAKLTVWDEEKISLAGSVQNFNRFYEAAKTQSKYIVYDA